MNDSESLSLKGQFLIAMPRLLDPNFFKTVTCLSEHSKEGALGVIINRIFPSFTLKDIFNELNIGCVPEVLILPVHIGGPVNTNQLFVLHGPPFEWEACHQVSSTLALSNSRDILEAIGMNRGPELFLISLGCAGWAPGQLEWEIKENSWLTTDIVEDIIYKTPLESRWDETVKKMGIDPAFLTDFAGRA